MTDGFWEEEARRFCQNADYWRGECEKREARIAELERELACAESVHRVAVKQRDAAWRQIDANSVRMGRRR